MERATSGLRADLLLTLGALLWLVALLARWPLAVSFGDEVGYLAEVRMMLDGRLRPLAESPGVWVVTDHGAVSKFPLLLPLILTPLFAIHPRLVFAAGAAAALGLTFVASRILKAWGRSPLWALIVLAHPSIVIMSRTVMADLPAGDVRRRILVVGVTPRPADAGDGVLRLGRLHEGDRIRDRGRPARR